jgi:hypothetical protein
MTDDQRQQLRDRLLAFCSYRALWVIDFEFTKDCDLRPDVICAAGFEIRSGRIFALRRDQLGDKPPYDIGADSIVFFYSGQEAELACHLSLGWDLPENSVDLIVVYRMAINGRGGNQELSLFAALARCRIAPRVSLEEKRRAQKRASEGWPIDPSTMEWLVSYCLTDVLEEVDLTLWLGPAAVSPIALWHGKAVNVYAKMWWRGVPIDPIYVPLVTDLTESTALVDEVVADISDEWPIFDNGVLKRELLEKAFIAHGIPVPRTPKAKLPSAKLATLARRAEKYSTTAPQKRPLELLEGALRTREQLQESVLPIGADNRLRAWFALFWTITSRAAPPTNAYIYNLPAWMRALMMTAGGWALAYLDWASMEFGLAAALSGCPNMTGFYRAGDDPDRDTYLELAKAVGGAPRHATKQSHPDIRALYKTGALACLYGIGTEELAKRLKRSTPFAREFLRMHHEVFADYWRWSDGVVSGAIHTGSYTSRHGWHYAVRPPLNTRSLRNWPIQTMGADILRCAVIFADALGVEMLATAHDAVLMQAREGEIEGAKERMAYCMERSALLLTGGFRLRVDIDIKHQGERFLDPRGERTFAVVEKFMKRRAANAA